MKVVLAEICILGIVTPAEEFPGVAQVEGDGIHRVIVQAEEILRAFGFGDRKLPIGVRMTPVLMPVGKAIFRP